VFDGLTKLLNRKFVPVILSTTYRELQVIANKSPPKVRKCALLAIRLAEKCLVIHVEQQPGESQDDVIIRMAEEWRCPVATNDKELRKRLRNKFLPTIFLRGSSHFELDGATQ
jgi:hypothetical protein